MSTLPDLDGPLIKNPIGLGPGSSVQAIRDRLKELKAPVYGTKQMMYQRLQQYETKAKAERLLMQDLQQRQAERIDGADHVPVRALPSSKPPTEIER